MHAYNHTITIFPEFDNGRIRYVWAIYKFGSALRVDGGWSLDYSVACDDAFNAMTDIAGRSA